MDAREVCVTCTQNCMLLHGQKKEASSVDKSFVKVLYGGYEFSKYLYLPPNVSQTIPVLGDGQCHILEDSNGQRWPVTLGNSNGALAFENGWELFYADHDLKEGYVLQFDFLHSHFLVKIYDRTCTLKLNFCKANDNKERSNSNESAEKQGSQKISDDLTKNQVSTSVASGSERQTQGRQMIKGKPSHPSVSQNGDGTGSSVISRAVKLGAYNRTPSQPRQCLPPLVVNPDNLPSPENKDGSQLLIKDKPSCSSVISGSDNTIQSQPMTMYIHPSSEDGDGGRKLSSTTLVKFRGENGKESQIMTKDRPPSTSVRASIGDRAQWQQKSKEKPSGSQNGDGGFKPPSTTTVTVRKENRREIRVISKEMPMSTSVILRLSDRVQSQRMSKDKTSNSGNGNSGLKLPSTTSIVSKAENRGETKGMTKDKAIITNVISELGDRTQSKLMLKDKPLSSENGNSGSQLPLSDGYDTVQLSRIYTEYKYEENVTHFYDPAISEKQGGVDADGSIDSRTHPSNTLVEPKTCASILNENPGSKKLLSGKPPAEVANFKAFSDSRISDTSMRKNVAVVENDGSIDSRTHPSNTLVEPKTCASILNENPASKKLLRGKPPVEVANFKAFSDSRISDTSMRKNVAVVENDGSIDSRTHPSNTLVEPKTCTSILNEHPASKKLLSGKPPAEVANFEEFSDSRISDTSMRKNVAVVENDGSIDSRTHPSNTLVEPKTCTSILNENPACTSILNENPASKKLLSGKPSAEVANFKAFSDSRTSDTSMRKNVAVVENDHKDHLSGLPFKKRFLVEKEDTTERSMKSKIINRQETAGRSKQSGELMKIPEKELIESGKVPSPGQMNSGKDNEVCNALKTEPLESFNQACLGTSGDSCMAVVVSTEYMKLQKRLPSISLRKRADRRAVCLRGPDNLVWPVLYIEKGGAKALASGWRNFYHSNGLKEGDECTFIHEEMPHAEPLYKVVLK